MTNSASELFRENATFSWKFWKSKRYVVALMIFFGMIANYSIRSLLSVAIVDMTKVKTIHFDNGTVSEEQEFVWNSKEKGLVLSALFYGYICTMSIGGYLACKFGGSLVFSIGILGASILTIMTPFSTAFGLTSVIVVRAIVGLFEGAAFISIYAIFGKWAPPNERSTMISLSMAGIQFGNICGMFFGGILADHFGWRSIFYVFGGYGCILFIVWTMFIRESPSKDKFISENERRYINESLKNVTKIEKQPIPWKAIVLSIPFHAYNLSSIAEMWGVFTLMTSLPLFFNDVLHVDVKLLGILSGVPYICMSIALPLVGRLADLLLKKGVLGTSQVRRYFTLISFVGQAILLVVGSHLKSKVWIITCFMVSVGFNAFAFSGYFIAPLEMAPQFASVISGFGQTSGALSGVISPILTGYIVQNRNIEEWQIVFYITSGLYFIGGVAFFFFGSSELQPWAKVPKTKNDNHCNKLLISK